MQSRKVTTAKFGVQELDLVPDVQHVRSSPGRGSLWGIWFEGGV